MMSFKGITCGLLHNHQITDNDDNDNNDTKNDSSVTISVSIVGNAFVNLVCNGGTNNEEFPPSCGTTVSIDEPLMSTAGGAAMASATHLSALHQHLNTNQMDISVQTAYKDSDDYGRWLVRYATQCGFQLLNCASNDDTTAATGHCLTLQNTNTNDDSSIIHHWGVLSMFHPSDTQFEQLVNTPPTTTTTTTTALTRHQHHHHQHIHITGYLPKFFKHCVKFKRRLHRIRETRRNRSIGSHAYTTTVSFAPSLKLNIDWIVPLLSEVDVFILNRANASQFLDRDIHPQSTALDRTVALVKLAKLMESYNPTMYTIVTLGSKGAVALHSGAIDIHANCPEILENYSSTINNDATHAFSAGFLHGYLLHLHNDDDTSRAVQHGMNWACVTGTAFVKHCTTTTSTTSPSILQHCRLTDTRATTENDTKVTTENETDAYETNTNDATNETNVPKMTLNSSSMETSSDNSSDSSSSSHVSQPFVLTGY